METNEIYELIEKVSDSVKINSNAIFEHRKFLIELGKWQEKTIQSINKLTEISNKLQEIEVNRYKSQRN